MKIKVCGMRNAENIKAVSKLPIQYMGFIFYEKSPRFVGDKIETLSVSKKIKKVGVFVHSAINDIVQLVEINELQAIQIHWDPPPQYLSDLKTALTQKGLKKTAIWKAFAVDNTFNFTETETYEGFADLFLFDTKSPQHGGTGQKFDWSILSNYKGKTPFLLAGGISENDAHDIKKLELPLLFGVDLNSKFEIEPAVKDIISLKTFIQNLKT